MHGIQKSKADKLDKATLHQGNLIVPAGIIGGKHTGGAIGEIRILHPCTVADLIGQQGISDCILQTRTILQKIFDMTLYLLIPGYINAALKS